MRLERKVGRKWEVSGVEVNGTTGLREGIKYWVGENLVRPKIIGGKTSRT